MPIGVVNANQVKSNKWVVDVFKSSLAHILFVFFAAIPLLWEELIECPSETGYLMSESSISTEQVQLQKTIISTYFRKTRIVLVLSPFWVTHQSSTY